MRRLACSAATVLALLAFSPAVQASKSGDPPATGEVIALNFDWPDRLHGQVHHTMVMTQLSQGRQSRISIDMHYEMTTTPAPKGLLIRTENVKTAVDMAGMPGGANPIRKLMTELTSQSPAYLVSNDGRFLRIHDLPGFTRHMVKAMEDGLGAMMPRALPAPAMAQLKHMLVAMFNETTLHATASAEWDMYVGGWRDLRLKTGDVRKFAVTAPVPMLGNAKVPMYGTVVLKGRTACRDGERELGCVELQMQVAAGEKEMAAAMQAYLQRVTGQRQTPDMQRIRQTRFVRIVCNPSTLLPYASDSRNETAIYGKDKAPTTESVREEHMRYSY